MVLFCVKRDNHDELLFQTPISTSNSSLIGYLCHIHNLQLRLAALANALESITCYDVTKTQAEHEYYKGGAAASHKREQIYAMDQGDHLMSEGMSSQFREALARVAADAKIILDSKTQLARQVYIDETELLEKLQNIREAVAMAFPKGLPNWNPMKLMLNAESAEEALLGSSAAVDIIPEETAELRWAGKQFLRDQVVRDIVGENEKSTLMVTLQKKGDGPPNEKSIVSGIERNAMTATCYNKQQPQLQQTAQDHVDDYNMLPPWVDLKVFKNEVHGSDGA